MCCLMFSTKMSYNKSMFLGLNNEKDQELCQVPLDEDFLIWNLKVKRLIKIEKIISKPIEI